MKYRTCEICFRTKYSSENGIAAKHLPLIGQITLSSYVEFMKHIDVLLFKYSISTGAIQTVPEVKSKCSEISSHTLGIGVFVQAEIEKYIADRTMGTIAQGKLF